MNERIQELAEQALNYAEKNQSADIPRHWFKLHNEKFAELIVRECVGIADEYDGVGSTIVSRIKQHFGVEE
jgi:hypothetical protein